MRRAEAFAKVKGRTMQFNWKPSGYDAADRCAGLTRLFYAGADKGLPPQNLCTIAADIASLSPHDTAQIAELSQALIEVAPDHPEAWSFRAQSLRMSGDSEAAFAACDNGLSIDPANPNLMMQQATLLMHQGDNDAAAKVLEKLAISAPGLASSALCECLIMQGRTDQARSLIENRRSVAALPTGLLSFSYACDVVAGEAERSLLRDNALISQNKHPVELAGLDTAQFNAQLRQSIISSDAMRPDPASTATMAGRQGFINQVLPRDLTQQVISMIESNIEAYVEERAGRSYLANAPAELGITSWAVALETTGYQASHTHPAGWLSGVYYVDVGDPPEKRDGGASGAGSIEFWQPPEALVGQTQANPSCIQPSAGMMLIFPSYVYHRTVPYQGKRPRISIAFDIG